MLVLYTVSHLTLQQEVVCEHGNKLFIRVDSACAVN